MHRLNWKYIVILVVGAAILAGTAYTLRNWQKNRMAMGRLTSGNIAYEQGHYEKAAQDLGKYLVVVPDDIHILLKYADAQLHIRPLKRNNIQHAISSYRVVLRIEPKNLQAARKLVELYLQMGMHGESELIARRQLESTPDPNIQRMLIVSLVGQRKFRETATELQNIINSRPDDVLAYEAMSQLCQQRPEQFRETPEYWLDEAIRKNPISAMAYIMRASYRIQKHDPKAAIADLNAAEKLELTGQDVKMRLIREFINSDQLDRAQAHLKTLQQINPRTTELWQAWAMYAVKSGSKPEMVRIAQDGINQLSNDPWDFMPIAAELFITGGEYVRAAQCLNRLDQQDIAPETVAFLRGLLAEQQGQGYQAVGYFRQAIQLGNKTPRLRMTMAGTLAKLGDEQSAIQQMRALVSEQPELVEERNYLASLLIQNGEPEEALQQAQEAMQYAPGNLESKAIAAQAQIQQINPKSTQDSPLGAIEKQLAWLENAGDDPLRTRLLRFQFSIQTGKYDQAARYLTEMQKLAPDNIDVQIGNADLLVAQNKIEDAQALLKAMIKKFPQSSAPVRYIANMLASSGKSEQSQEILAEAIARIDDPKTKRQLGLMLCDQYRQSGKKDKACAILEELDKKLTNDIVIKRKLLTFEHVVENAARADSLIKQIKAAEGAEGWQWRYEQAKLWFVLKNFRDHVSQIVSLLQENLRANPEDQESRLLLAMTYDRAGEMQLAVSIYDEALGRSPKDLRIIVPALAAMYKAKEFEKADRVLNQALKDNLSNPILSGYQLQSNIRRGQLNIASNILEELKSSDPNNSALDLYQAMVKMRQKNYEAASQVLLALKVRQPNSLQVLSALVELNLRQNKLSEAVAFADEAVKNIKISQSYLLRAKTHNYLGNYAIAQRDFEKAVSMDSNDIDSMLAKSDFYFSRGLMEKAAASLESAMALHPENKVILKQALTTFVQSSDPALVKRGQILLDRAIKTNPSDLDLQYWKARTLLMSGTGPALDESLKILSRYTDSRPMDLRGWTMLCQAYMQKNDPAQALDSALRALVYLPDNRNLLLLKARAEAARNTELAIPTLKLLHEHDPNDSEAALYLAGLHVNGSNYQEAITLLNNQLVRATPGLQKRISIALAVAMYKNGQKQEAMDRLEKLSLSDPNDNTVLIAQAGLLKDEQKWTDLLEKVKSWYKLHNSQDSVVLAVANDLASNKNADSHLTAEKLLRESLIIRADSRLLLSGLARMLFMSGKTSEAAQFYQKLLAVDSNNLMAINNLAWILCEEQGRHKEALEIAQKGLKTAPDYIDLLDTRGIAYFRLGKYDEAIKDFNKCAKLYPGHVPSAVASYFHLGRALAAQGSKDEAVKYLKLALDSNPKIGGLSASDVTEAQNLLGGLIKEPKL